MADTTYSRVVLASLPSPSAPVPVEAFKLETLPLSSLKDSLGPNDILIKVLWVSIDPGKPLLVFGLGTVDKVGGEVTKHKVGDVVMGPTGWAEYAITGEQESFPMTIIPGTELVDYLGPLGAVGMTAYFGLSDVAKAKPGEIAIVTAAAGATGSLACQIGKAMGLKVIGIAGSDDKCKWLEDEFGVDKALNSKSGEFKEDFVKALEKLKGEGSKPQWDVLFENVGGEVMDFVIGHAGTNARIAFSGGISDYNTQERKGLTNYLILLWQRVNLRGFLCSEFLPQWPEATVKIVNWMKEGKVKSKYTILEGVDKCPEAFAGLFVGKNVGKMVVKV